MNNSEWVGVCDLTTEWHKVGLTNPLQKMCPIAKCLRPESHDGECFPTPDHISPR